MLTRQEYMAASLEDQAAKCRQYYSEIALAVGVKPSERLLEMCRNGPNKDGWFNDVHNSVWDRAALPYKDLISSELKKRGDFWSLSGGLITMKMAVALILEAEQKPVAEADNDSPGMGG